MSLARSRAPLARCSLALALTCTALLGVVASQYARQCHSATKGDVTKFHRQFNLDPVPLEPQIENYFAILNNCATNGMYLVGERATACDVIYGPEVEVIDDKGTVHVTRSDYDAHNSEGNLQVDQYCL